MAEAISDSTKTPVFEIISSEPAIVENFDLLILGTPVEGFRPAKETMDFIERLPKTEGKKPILFRTYALWKGRTFKVLEKELSSKGYDIIPNVSKQMNQDKLEDFSNSLKKIKKMLEKLPKFLHLIPILV